ncbi:ABC transporter ATP-binding protein [Paenibacillus aquistagni]|uniref:ABC-2 type transport system ATP-binding protein n=1 Tax=Paenibacillus aquistagni TaxID=1852522 RepID=A0A1X7LHM7_9BACL|nr:ABC transporter ATP-binding protein [Paenibacillus aquistagni]SMG53366.1 ABC-2 type transport system ATP-binding protein [Paenibacillus aquistagni]
MNDIVVEIRNVTKKMGGKTIIDNLSFSVERGEIYGFLGPNGAGKTTTIRMMVGLMSMNAGEIIIEGHNVATDRAKAMMHVGAIVENPELYKFMTGRQNLIHFARMSGRTISEERIQEIVKLVDLDQALDKKVKNYSLGMRQRLGIAQALLHHPSILILDEPTNGLDPAGIRELRDYLRRLSREENISILVSSHLLSEIELMCDRVLIIQNGQYVGERLLDGSKEGSQAEELQSIQLQVETMEEIQQALQDSAWSITSAEGNRVTLSLPHHDIPQLIEHLVKQGVKLYEVRKVTPTLEDTFLQMTKGGRIQ